MQIQNQLENAVKALCPDITKSTSKASERKWTERALWKEVLTCILSSQVRNEVAQVAANNIIKNVYPWSSKSIKTIEMEVLEILTEPLNVNGNYVRYRFPNAKASQVTNSINRTTHSNISLSGIVYSDEDTDSKRNMLVELISGMGYKQASMFLRNIGCAFDLAILDRHIFAYMDLLEISNEIDRTTLTKNKYLRIEEILKNYAACLGYAVGCVDWAIWIVMRTAKQEGYV